MENNNHDMVSVYSKFRIIGVDSMDWLLEQRLQEHAILAAERKLIVRSHKRTVSPLTRHMGVS